MIITPKIASAAMPSLAFMAFESKEALFKALSALKSEKPELLHLVGFINEDGAFQPLSAEDIR